MRITFRVPAGASDFTQEACESMKGQPFTAWLEDCSTSLLRVVSASLVGEGEAMECDVEWPLEGVPEIRTLFRLADPKLPIQTWPLVWRSD